MCEWNFAETFFYSSLGIGKSGNRFLAENSYLAVSPPFDTAPSTGTFRRAFLLGKKAPKVVALVKLAARASS